MTDKEVHKLRRHELIELLLKEVKQVDHFKEVATVAETENQRIKGKLNDKDAQIENLKKKLNDKDKKLNDKDAQIQELEEIIEGKDAELEEIIEGKDVQLEEQRKFIEDKDARLEEQDKIIKDIDARLKDIGVDAAQKDAQIERLKEDIAGRDTEVENLRKRLSERETEILWLRRRTGGEDSAWRQPQPYDYDDDGMDPYYRTPDMMENVRGYGYAADTRRRMPVREPEMPAGQFGNMLSQLGRLGRKRSGGDRQYRTMR